MAKRWVVTFALKGGRTTSESAEADSEREAIEKATAQLKPEDRKGATVRRTTVNTWSGDAMKPKVTKDSRGHIHIRLDAGVTATLARGVGQRTVDALRAAAKAGKLKLSSDIISGAESVSLGKLKQMVAAKQIRLVSGSMVVGYVAVFREKGGRETAIKIAADKDLPSPDGGEWIEVTSAEFARLQIGSVFRGGKVLRKGPNQSLGTPPMVRLSKKDAKPECGCKH